MFITLDVPLSTAIVGDIQFVFSCSWLLAQKTWTTVVWVVHAALALLHLLGPAPSYSLSFPSSGNGLWYTTPGTVWARDFLPVGNGHLGGGYVLLDLPHLRPTCYSHGARWHTTGNDSVKYRDALVWRTVR